MMNDPGINQNQQKNRTRPALLSVLCVLTFIGSGISSISFLMVYFSYQEVIPMIHELSEVFPGVELFAKSAADNSTKKNDYDSHNILVYRDFLHTGGNNDIAGSSDTAAGAATR